MADSISSPLREPHRVESLDGIRGVAILMVLISHAGWFTNGWVGVDLFFVLSGYLITGILRKSTSDPFYWRRFYIKRATRILPPFVLGIVVVGLLWPHASFIVLGGYLLSLGNLMNISRFDILPLDHFWSLSVEEHYYLFWPLAVLTLSRRRLQWLLAAIIVAEPVIRFAFTFVLTRHDINPIYFLTPFRIDGIALGSLLALMLEQNCWRERLKRCAGPGAIVGAAVFMTLWTVLGHIHFFPFSFNPIFNAIGYWLVAVTAFFLVAHACVLPDSLLTRLLRNRMLVALGTISYGVYVYHWILMTLVKHYFTSLTSLQAGIGNILCSILIAAILFRVYERPITMWGKRMAAGFSTEARVTVATETQAEPPPTQPTFA